MIWIDSWFFYVDIRHNKDNDIRFILGYMTTILGVVMCIWHL